MNIKPVGADGPAEVIVTHKGWFGLCPVYLGNPDGEAPLVVERHITLLPLFILSEWMFQLVFMMTDSYMWPLRITGELKEPITFSRND
jgi:hypothetical protein